MKNIEISVIMAEYNTNIDFLVKSIESILHQTYKNFELIIVDDCGKNDLEQICARFGDGRIKIIHNTTNKGLAESLNSGILEAKGKYICRMDTDDISLPDRLEKQITFAENNPEYSIIGGNYILFDEKKEYGKSDKYGKVDKESFLVGTPFAHPTLMINKADLINSGMYPNYRRAQDYAMEMQMYSMGYKGFIIKDVVLKYRQDSDGYKKKKYKYRVLEYKIRKKYFKMLRVSGFKRFISQNKPLVVGLIPRTILKLYREKKTTKF
mgnify:CR=1 FL=1